MIFTAPLEDVSVEAEEEVTLQCELSKPNQKVTWLKNGKPLTAVERKKYRIAADGTKHTLTIPKTAKEDAAQFTCALNGTKTQSTVTVRGQTFSDHRRRASENDLVSWFLAVSCRVV